MAQKLLEGPVIDIISKHVYSGTVDKGVRTTPPTQDERASPLLPLHCDFAPKNCFLRIFILCNIYTGNIYIN